MAAHKHEYFSLVSRHLNLLPSACITHAKNSFIEFWDLEIMDRYSRWHCVAVLYTG